MVVTGSPSLESSGRGAVLSAAHELGPRGQRSREEETQLGLVPRPGSGTGFEAMGKEGGPGSLRLSQGNVTAKP